MTSPVITTADSAEKACAGRDSPKDRPLCVEDVVDAEHEHHEQIASEQVGNSHVERADADCGYGHHELR